MTDVRLELKVGGKWLRQFGAWGSLTFSTSWPGGSKEASWTMSSRYGARLPVLRRNASVQVYACGWCLWSGYLSEPDWNGNDVSLTANGLFRRGELYEAFDFSTNATYNPTTAINAAPGLGWTIGAGIPNSDLVTVASDLYTITGLLDAHAQQLGQRWQVNAFGVVSMSADPQSPQGATYLIRQGAGDLGIADDNYASHTVIRYQRSVDGTYASAVYPPNLRGGVPNAYEVAYGHAESALDITDRGPVADSLANQIAQAVYMRSMQRPGWTNGLQLAHGEVLTTGYRPRHPALVSAGRLARKLGTPDEVAMTSWTDFVVGSTEYADGSGLINIDPVALASRSQEDVLTDVLEGYGLSDAA